MTNKTKFEKGQNFLMAIPILFVTIILIFYAIFQANLDVYVVIIIMMLLSIIGTLFSLELEARKEDAESMGLSTLVPMIIVLALTITLVGILVYEGSAEKRSVGAFETFLFFIFGILTTGGALIPAYFYGKRNINRKLSK